MRIMLFFVLVVLLCACQHSMDYASQNLSAGWSFSNVISFTLEEQDRTAASPINIIVDHSIDYGYENLYLIISTSGAMSTSDTISLQLADTRGSWLSSCRSDHCLFTYPYELSHSEGKVAEVSVRQYSREEVLKGINQIGIEL